MLWLSSVLARFELCLFRLFHQLNEHNIAAITSILFYKVFSIEYWYIQYFDINDLAHDHWYAGELIFYMSCSCLMTAETRISQTDNGFTVVKLLNLDFQGSILLLSIV